MCEVGWRGKPNHTKRGVHTIDTQPQRAATPYHAHAAKQQQQQKQQQLPVIMRAIASSFRNLYRQSLETKTAALDSRTRTELARDVQQFTSSHVEELEQVNDSIEQAKLALEDLEEKKRFVAMRLEIYQEKLEQRAKRLRLAEERLHGVSEEEEEEQEEYEETRPLGGTPTRNPTPHGVNVMEIHQVQDADDDDDTSHESKDEETTPSLSMEDLEKQKERLQSEQAALERVHVAHAEMERNVLQLQRKIIILERIREQVLTKTRECRDFLVVAAQMQDDDDLEEGPFVQSDELSEEDTEETLLQSDQLSGEGNEGPFLQSDQLSGGRH